MNTLENQVAERINKAVAKADTTKKVIIGTDVLTQTPSVFKECFKDADVVIVADKNTFAAAGRAVMDAFAASGKKNIVKPLILDDPDLYAEYRFVEKVANYLKTNNAIPVAVGSGTINDLTKIASHLCGRNYMVVATAASMDGYTAFGASITKDCLKQTLSCPAPIAVVADADVIQKAPVGMNSWGYADLIAKIPAGADWIVADALGIEAIDPKSWTIVQPPLRDWVSNPKGIKDNDRNALIKLTEGLIMSGLGMQASQSSRPASGAEHQFSHLWDGDHHTHNGIAPSHGIKVGIGSVCVEALYENILKLNQDSIQTDVEAIKLWWPEWKMVVKMINERFTNPILASQVVEQSRAKYLSVEKLSERLKKLVSVWPELQIKLKKQLLGAAKMQEMLRISGAASLPTEIGIDYKMLHDAFRHSQLIRKRYTVLDLTLETGMWRTCVDELFGDAGFWGRNIKTSKITAINTKTDLKDTYQKA
jgi:glycerol-1-phosphate dehydrogenase [NAD(P)+]